MTIRQASKATFGTLLIFKVQFTLLPLKVVPAVLKSIVISPVRAVLDKGLGPGPWPVASLLLIF